MAFGVRLGCVVDEVGSSDFLNSFFSTVFCLLEKGVPGSVFPTFGDYFYMGHVPVEKLKPLLDELSLIKEGLSKYPPSEVVWDFEDRSKLPPWGNNISSDITSMGNYFVSSTGRDLFDIFFDVLNHAISTKRPIDIVEV